MDFIYYITKDFIHYSAIALLLAAIPAGLIVAITRRKTFTVHSKMFSSWPKTGAVSTFSVVLLAGLAFVTAPSNDSQVRSGQKSTVSQQLTPEQNSKIGKETTIETKLVEVTKPITYEKREKKMDSWPVDRQKIKQAGRNGTKVLTYEVEYDNGKEISRKLKAEKIIKKPIAEIVLISASRGHSNKSRASAQDADCKSFYRVLVVKFYGGNCKKHNN